MSDEEDLDDGLVTRITGARQNPALITRSVLSQSNLPINDEGYEGPRYNLAWVNALHQRILHDVRTRGIEACRWCNVLEKWKESLTNAPFEEVELGCIRLIMQHARLTPVAQPTFYETLRKLGKDILSEDLENDDIRGELLHRLLTPTTGDSAMYTQYFGARERWEDRRALTNHLDKLHAQYGSSLSQELTKERVLGFMVPHIRSNRYHPVELGAILRHFVRDIDGAQHWNNLADILQNEAQVLAEQSSEAQAFILRCFENIYRARQSLKGAEKRSAAVGVILFADSTTDVEHGEMHPTRLDMWFDETMQNPSDRAYQNPLERCSLRMVQALLASEEREWNIWAPRLQNRRAGEFRIASQPLFQLLGPSQLAASSLLSHVMNSIKAYCEKKKSLRDLAYKSSRRQCVKQAIEDWGADLQQAAATVPRGGHRIAVFGYTLNGDGRGVPEAEEQSVIVRSVRLTRKCGGDESGGVEALDTCVFEVGVSLSGSYLDFKPEDSDELHDMLKTSGLGLGKEDVVTFFRYMLRGWSEETASRNRIEEDRGLRFVPQGQHSPRSKLIDYVLRKASDGDALAFTHALLTIPDNPAPGSRRLAKSYEDIADAGGRFLVDLRRAGNVRTEGQRYQALAVEPAAAVAVDEDMQPRPFRRLAVLLPPSMVNEMPHGYQLGRLGLEVDRGSGFQESAEIIAEVLSLVAIDRSKMDDSADPGRYSRIIRAHLEGNPLLLYYTTVDLLNAVDPAFASVIAEYWEEKLGLGYGGIARNLSTEQQESRRMVFSLITSGVPRSSRSGGAAGALVLESPHRSGRDSDAGVGTSGSVGSRSAPRQGTAAAAGLVAAGKKIALATEGHLKLLPDIIQQETHFSQEEIYVEDTNFESVLLRLKRASPTSLTFVFVHVTGRVSADQINQLVSVPAAGSTIKLIFRYSQSLASLLDLTPSIRDAIHRPESITQTLSGKMQTVTYSVQSAVGAMVVYNTGQLTSNPTAVSTSGPFWDTEYPEHMVSQAAQWKEKVDEWIGCAVDSDAGPAEYLRIVVTPDDGITARELEAAVAARERAPRVRVVDAGDPARFDELKSFVESRTAPAFSYSRLRHAELRPAESEEGQGVDDSAAQLVSEVFILRRATFLRHSRLEVLVSRCCARRIKLILLTSEATSAISRFRVFKDPASPPTWVRVPIVMQRLLRACPSARLHQAFMGLQLLFSQEAVVSDYHFNCLQGFLNGPSTDISSLDFLDHAEGIPADRAGRGAIILALACTDDATTAVPTILSRKSLAEIIAMHINRYLRFPVDECQTLPLSFSDFCRQPRTRFLSQIHRVEAYMCYIFSKTRHVSRLHSSASSDIPLGFPLTACFKGINKNIHSPSSPGVIMSARFERDYLSPMEWQVCVPAAQYTDPGRGDVVTHMFEIAEHRAISGAELHWEEMARKWESGPELTEDILDHILVHSPSRMSVLLSMTPPQIVNLCPSAEALDAVSRDFSNCRESLRRLQISTSCNLRTRSAAIWWLILTKGSSGWLQQSSEESFAEDQGLLLDSGVYMEARSESSTSARTESDQLFIRVASAMLPLDRPDAFITQHAVRDFILSNENTDLVARILENETIKIGQAFVSACVARDTLNAILSGSVGNAVFNRMEHLLRWVKDSHAADIERIRMQSRGLISRFTPQAISCLLLSANPPVDLRKARDGILEPCLTLTQHGRGQVANNDVLNEILTPLCTDRHRGFVVNLFEVLATLEAGSSYVFPAPDLHQVPQTWRLIFSTMRSASHSNSMLHMAREEGFTLPFEASRRLCSIYVGNYSSEDRDVSLDLEEHLALLKTDLAREAIYEYMTGPDSDTIPANSSTLCLLWLCWWSMPWTSFPIRFLPSPGTWHLFQSVARRAEINQEKILKGLSTVARFARAPHTLTASMINALKCAMVDGCPTISSEKYVLAQLGHGRFPVYGFRCHIRPLPRVCIEALIQDMQHCQLISFSGISNQEKFKSLFPVTDSGVSVETVRSNLSILVHIHESPPSIEQDKTLEMRAQIFLPTLAWFYCAGISLEDLRSMCTPDDGMQLARNHQTMASTWIKANFPRAMVYCPLPVYVDVRYVCGKAGVLFQCNPDSANNTIQWLAMLGLQYNLENYNAANQFRDYAVQRSAGRNVDRSLPNTIVCNLMTDIARVIVRMYTTRLEHQIADHHDSCSAVVDDCVPLADFFAQIRHCSGSRKIALSAFEGLASGLREAEATIDLQVYIADALYMLIGITPVNSGVEVIHILQVWRNHGLTIGSSVIEEIQYMARSIYLPRGLEILAKNLEDQLNSSEPPLLQKTYVRNPANIPLSTVIQDLSDYRDSNIYAYNELALIGCPGRIVDDQQAPSTPPSSDPRLRIPSSHVRTANFDHARSVGSTPPSHYSSVQSESLAPNVDHNHHIDFFKAALADPTADNVSKLFRQSRHVSCSIALSQRTISARDLVSVDSGTACEFYSGYAVIRILPGQHPVLRSPGDSQNIPVSQQKKLGPRQRNGMGRNSFDREDHDSGDLNKIEAIFSNNGDTWENLSQLPLGSTIMGKGFYLRKSYEGWVFLAGATKLKVIESQPYVLWAVLDTLKLASLDFADIVTNTLKAALILAYNPSDTNGKFEDAAFQAILDEIRGWFLSSSARMTSVESENYVAFLKREWTVCKHLLDVMNYIHADESGSSVEDAFQLDQLERKLGVNVNSLQQIAAHITQNLAQFVCIRDCVPRSQLIFTLELVLANYPAHLRDISPNFNETPAREQPVETEGAPDDLFVNYDIFAEEQGATPHQGPSPPNDIARGSTAHQNRMIAAHEHITQRKFHEQSRLLIRRIEKTKQVKNRIGDWTKDFYDSDNEGPGDSTIQAQEQSSYGSQPEDDIVNDALRQWELTDERSNRANYIDDEIDMPTIIGAESVRRASPLFPKTWGYGRPICSKFCVPSILGEHVPLYFVQIDVRRLKIRYSDADGLPIAYLFHKRLLDRSLRSFRIESERSARAAGSRRSSTGDGGIGDSELSEEDKMLAYREELLRWLTDLARSPLPNIAKDWFLDKLENGATTRAVPSLSIEESQTNSRVRRHRAEPSFSSEHVGGDVNLVVIAHCIALAIPAPNQCKQLFRSAFHVPRGILSFCSRKNDLYGVHVVRGGTLQELQSQNAIVEVCNLGYDALIRSKDNASMYLSIIGHFSTFTWLVYVTGLDQIDDALLKWLAEYTKAHPWRFVYLENTQTSWNFAENRDRCIYTRAPPPVERNIRTEAHLKNPEVSQLRPTHIQWYPRVAVHCRETGVTEDSVSTCTDWETMVRFTCSFFRNAAARPSAHAARADEGREMGDGNAWSVARDDADALHDDYRTVIRRIFRDSEQCVVLLCSPPGAGKSHFSNELAEMLKRKHSIGRAFIDGSDDRFVDMSLTEILAVELPDPTKSQFLIVDEFHMLKEHHKHDLFAWIEVNGRRLHVLLIANRKDANDEKLLEELRRKGATAGIHPARVCHFTTRLGNTLLSEVMRKRGTDAQTQNRIRRWMHCARCLFGGEAVSLRNIKGLEDRLRAADDKPMPADELMNLLLDKVPTVSETTAREFMTAFLASLDGQERTGGDQDGDGVASSVHCVAHKVKGPVSLMVQAALLTEHRDLIGMDFPDFVSSGLQRAYDAPPALRIAAWCCHMRALAGLSATAAALVRMDAPACAFQAILVDQCGFPLQLEEEGARRLLLADGPAFSWGGDYSRMRDIIDAVRHGHSVDWADVHDRCWRCEPVQDGRQLVELLSVCTSPGKVLDALTRDNLCALLKKSGPDDSLHIALEVLRCQVGRHTAQKDGFLSPYRTAVWMVMCYDKTLREPEDMLDRLGCPESAQAASAAEGGQVCRAVDGREEGLSDALIWASTHMQDMLTCRSDDEPRRRTALLCATLAFLTRLFIAIGDRRRAPRLWGGMFSPLLRAEQGVSSAARGDGSGGWRPKDTDLVQYVALHADDANGRWGDPVPALWAIAHGRGTAAQVADIWVGYRWLLLADDDPASPVHPRLAGGILCVTGVIPADLQTALLTRGGDADLELVGDRLDRAVALIRGAAEVLARGEAGESGLRVAHGPFRELALREIRRFREEDPGEIDE